MLCISLPKRFLFLSIAARTLKSTQIIPIANTSLRQFHKATLHHYEKNDKNKSKPKPTGLRQKEKEKEKTRRRDEGEGVQLSFRSRNAKNAKQKIEFEQKKELMDEVDAARRMIDHNIPESIRTVKVVEEESKKFHGELPLKRAIELARSLGKNLILMAKDLNAVKSGAAPLCKIGNYKSYLLKEKSKLSDKHKELYKKKIKAFQAKEIRFSPNIGEGDIKSKVNKICKTLADETPVKVVVTGSDVTVGNILTSKILEMTQRVLVEQEADFDVSFKPESSSNNSVISMFEVKEKEKPKEPPKPKKVKAPVSKTPVPHDSPVEVPTEPATQTPTPEINK
ncbi:translation initiation factor IF-3 [Acrasis kona]|uniref:Translation initiation factor IF-3 n=1 Tax=Acrasis kona TaxID=1008807 RepID=A0AAW2ZAQ9_9EUKA